LREASREGWVETAPRAVGGGFGRRVRWEIVNQLATLLLAPFYPHYRRHRSHHPAVELFGWVRRLAKRPSERAYTARLAAHMVEAGRDYYLLPLQLDTDFQIRRHSKFRSMREVMGLVMDSFARAAPEHACLVIKVHPLDNGLVDFRREANRLAGERGLSGRVLVIDGGHLPTLLAKSCGVVVVNSTSGLSALHHNCPLKALGRALFDLPGLTFQGELDRFWTEGTAPDQDLFRAFRKVVLRRAQVNGSFFTEAGLELAVEGVLHRMGVATMVSHAQLVTRAELRQAELAAAKSALVR